MLAKLASISLHALVLLTIPGLSMMTGMKFARGEWRDEISFTEPSLKEMFLLSIIYVFFIGPILTVWLITGCVNVFGETMVGDLILLLGPQLGPMSVPTFLLLLPRKDPVTMGQLVHYLYSFDTEGIAELLRTDWEILGTNAGNDFPQFAFRYAMAGIILLIVMPLMFGFSVSWLAKNILKLGSLNDKRKEIERENLSSRMENLETRLNQLEDRLKAIESSNSAWY